MPSVSSTGESLRSAICRDASAIEGEGAHATLSPARRRRARHVRRFVAVRPAARQARDHPADMAIGLDQTRKMRSRKIEAGLARQANNVVVGDWIGHG